VDEQSAYLSVNDYQRSAQSPGRPNSPTFAAARGFVVHSIPVLPVRSSGPPSGKQHRSAAIRSLLADEPQRRLCARVIYRGTLNQTEVAEGAAREPIPENVRLFVWQRDKGQCVRCGSRERFGV